MYAFRSFVLVSVVDVHDFIVRFGRNQTAIDQACWNAGSTPVRPVYTPPIRDALLCVHFSICGAVVADPFARLLALHLKVDQFNGIHATFGGK